MTPDDQTVQNVYDHLCNVNGDWQPIGPNDIREILTAAAPFLQGEPSPRAQALEEDSLQELLERLDAGLEYEGDLETENDHIELFNVEAAQELFTDAAAAIRALSSQPVEDGWLPIETAPKDTVVDLWCVHAEHAPSLCRDAKLTNGQWLSGYFEEPLNAGWTPTHWRPLPASPEVQG